VPCHGFDGHVDVDVDVTVIVYHGISQPSGP